MKMSELLARVRALIYLYFDALEFKVGQELNNKCDILILNGRKLSYEDAIKILQLKDKLEILAVIEKELNELLDGIYEKE